ncbi:N-acetylmuramoyl-L-alanine amidase [Parafilimonas sp.]|uniref:N-acetylmuramoyl-L-alanine amidase n=1 Tax=Parafilimonas sp. TaxID=1969739 RepID=UPI003F8216E2
MLQQLSIYLLKVTSISGLLFLYYHIALRNKRFHYYNRFYLLMAVAISIILPLLKLEWFTFFSDSDQTIHLYKIIYGSGENEIIVTGKAGINWEQLALYCLAATSIFSLAVLCSRILKIKLLKKKYPVQQFTDFDFVHTDISSAPFSFLKDIFWRNDINLEDETGKQILQHEITHIRQKHSWDKLYMQFTLCFYWMNPFFHLIKKELYLIHEFIADEEAVKHADADAFAKMLLTAQFGKFNLLPAQSIFYSSIKRRLTMLTTSKKPQFSYARRLMVLPLITALVCLFAFTVKTRNSNNTIPPTVLAKPFVLVVDAGHGGKDRGALGNGMYEKDAALKIAQKIKDISSQYNIHVILTRNSDVFMDPKQKSDFANSQNADAFISIHVNTNDKEHPDQSGFEVLLSSRADERFADKNKILGSAILQNISKDFTAAPSLQTRNTGIWVLKNSNIPSVLIECGYITNKDDAANLKDDAKIELIAKNILEGIAAYANHAATSIRDTIPANILNVTADKQPLYVVDGKPSSEAEIKLIGEADIERIDVLKDSASRVIYGPKAKNGVVLITLKTSAKQSQEPLYVLDGKIVSKEEAIKNEATNIESVNVLKDKSAIDKYGDKGKNGVIEITSKNAAKEPIVLKVPDNVLYVIDGKVSSKEEYNKLDKKTIESVNVLKDKPAIDKYGDKGKHGVIEITSKNAAKEPIVLKVPDNVLYVIDGKISSKEEYDKFNKKNIQSIDVLKDKAATDKYGDKGKNGVIEITSKSQTGNNASNNNKSIDVKDSNTKPIFTTAQIEPQFPGGAEAWGSYLAKQLDASVLAKRKAPAGIYTVTLSFIVDEDGNLSDIKALNDPGYGAGAEAVRVLKQGPKWLPAIQNGHNVAFLNKQKIAFKISG